MKHGAPVDVFASASQKFMDDAQRHELIHIASRENFAQNVLVLAVPAKATSSLTDIAGLLQTEIQLIGIGMPESVPAGRYAKEALQAHGLWNQVQPKLVYGNSVRQVLDYLRRGEVDAGLIYATDAVIAGDSVRIVQNVEKQMPIIYPLATTTQSEHPDMAGQFIEFVLQESGQDILQHFGFISPD
jgi:molybdate transport system substrate-binding protein